jgi:hypothetical protein
MSSELQPNCPLKTFWSFCQPIRREGCSVPWVVRSQWITNFSSVSLTVVVDVVGHIFPGFMVPHTDFSLCFWWFSCMFCEVYVFSRWFTDCSFPLFLFFCCLVCFLIGVWYSSPCNGLLDDVSLIFHMKCCWFLLSSCFEQSICFLLWFRECS